MGRITIFSSNGCANSKLVQEKFDQYSIPYERICLSTYPNRRADMIKLTNCITTPQVFFNQEYIGGAAEVTSLLQQYDNEAQFSAYPSVFERISMEVLKGQSSPKKNGLLRMPSANDGSIGFNISVQQQNERIKSIYTVPITNEEESTVGKVTRDLMILLPSKKFGLSSVNQNCFRGSDAIKIFMKHYHFPSSKYATRFGQTLLRLGIIHRVSSDNISCNLFSEKACFRLQPLQSPDVLNTFRIWRRDNFNCSFLDICPSLTVSWLLQQMGEIVTSSTGASGRVDYNAALASARFKNFEENVCQLQLIKLNMMDNNEKKAFWINVYNLMMTHAFFRLRPKRVNSDFLGSVQYNVGGFIFSLEDIFHGILRSNSNHPKKCVKMFLKPDPRATFSLETIDCRIHFALNNGLGSCIFMHNYHKEAIEEELHVVAQLYCESNERIFISNSANQVIFPKFMKIFISDFTKKGEVGSLQGTISKFLSKSRRNTLDLMKMREKKTGEQVAVFFDNEFGYFQKIAIKSGIVTKSMYEGRKLRKKKLLHNWVELGDDDSDNSTTANSESRTQRGIDHIASQQKEDESPQLKEIDHVYMTPREIRRTPSAQSRKTDDVVDLGDIFSLPLCQENVECAQIYPTSSTQTPLTIDVSTDELSVSL